MKRTFPIVLDDEALNALEEIKKYSNKLNQLTKGGIVRELIHEKLKELQKQEPIRNWGSNENEKYI